MQPVPQREILVQEVQQHVAAFAVVVAVHRHLAEEETDVRVEDRDGAQAVPQVVEGKEGFCAGTRRLVFGTHERAAQLDGVGKVIADELFREPEHVRCGYAQRAVLACADVGTEQKAVTAQNLLGLRVPHYELAAGRVHQVVFVDIALLARAAAGTAEGYLAQASYFAHHIGARLCVHHIDDIAALVGGAQQAVGGKLRLQYVYRNGGNNRLLSHYR